MSRIVDMGKRLIVVAVAVGLCATSFGADLEVDAGSYAIEPGQTVRINVAVTNVDELASLRIKLKHDPALLEFDAAFGVQPSIRVTTSESFGPDDSGVLTFLSESLLGDTTVGAGSGTLFSYQLVGLARGLSALTFTEVAAADAAANELGPGEISAATDNQVDLGIGDVGFAPAGGSYATSQDVVISSEGSLGLFYTTDGSEPTTSSTAYAGPVTLGGPDGTAITLRALATAASGANKAAQADYLFDSTQPQAEVTLAAGQTQVTDAGPVVFAVTFTDGVTGFTQGDITVGGTAGADTATVTGGPLAFTVSVTGMSQDGTVNITVPPGAGQDTDTGVDSATPTDSAGDVVFDQTPATSTVTTAGAQGAQTWPEHISGTAADAVSGVASVTVILLRNDFLYWNGSTWVGQITELTATGTENWTLAISAAALSGGTNYQIQARAIDAAGNEQVIPTTNAFSFDTSPPNVSFTIGSGDPVATNSVSVTLAIAPDGDATHMRFANDDGPLQLIEDIGTSLSWTLAQAEGPRTVRGVFIDASGNEQETEDTIVLDLTPPTCSLNLEDRSYGPNSWPNVITVTAVDAITSVETSVITIQRASDGFYLGFSGWSPFSSEINAVNPIPFASASLTHGDTYTINATVTDSVGFEGTCSVTFSYDSVAPSGNFTIGVGNPDYVNTQSPTLDLLLTGADEMRLKNDGDLDFPEEWQAFVPQLVWDLKNRDGNRSVDAEFRDEAGNTLAGLSDGVILDRIEPQVTFTIGLDAPAFSNTRDVQLQALSADTADMRFYNDGITPGEWSDFSPISDWMLTAGDGAKTVRGEFKDLAGNVSALSDTIELDETPPEGSFSIADGALYLETNVTTLTMTVTGAAEMRFHNEGVSFPAEWDAYADTQAWTLPDEDGERTVSAQFRDLAGNVISSSDSIIIDRTDPTCSISVGGILGPVTWLDAVTGLADDDESGVVEVRVVIQRDSDGFYYNGSDWQAALIELVASGTTEWSSALPIDALSNEVSYALSAWATDAVGRSSTTALGGFTVDSAPPVCTITTTDAYRTATWPEEVAGTLADNAGFAAGEVAIRNPAGDYYDSGSNSWVGTRTVTAASAGNWAIPLGIGLLVDGTYTVECEATDLALNPSVLVTEHFVIDTIAPSGSFTFDEAPLINSLVLTLNLSVSGAMEMRFDLGEGFSEWEAIFSGGNLTLPAGEGLRTVDAKFADLAGNVFAATAQITVDTVAPTGTMSLNAGAPAITDSRNVDIVSAVDGAPVTMRIRNSNEAATTIDYATSAAWILPDSEGSHEVFVEYEDEAGNILALSDSIILDRESPICEIDTVGLFNGTTWQDEISGTAGDSASGVAGVTLTIRRGSDSLYRQLDGSWDAAEVDLPVVGTSDWSFSLPLDQLEDLVQYTITCTATDIAGRIGTNVSVVEVDTTAPSCAIDVDAIYQSPAWPNTLLGSAADAGGLSSVLISVQRGSDDLFFNGGGWSGSETFLPATGTSPWLFPFSLGVLSEGVVYTVNCRPLDRAGNTGVCQAQFELDDTPPSGTFSIGEGQPVGLNTPFVQLFSETDDAIEMRIANETLNFGSWLAVESPFDWVLVSLDGSRRVRAEFRDLAGNVLALEDTVILDRNAPVCVIDREDGAVYTAATWPETVSGTATDDRSGLRTATLTIQNQENGEYYDGAAWTAVATEIDISASPWLVNLSTDKLQDGASFSITCQLEDEAGNIANDIQTLTYDNTPPVCTSDFPASAGPSLWPDGISGTFADDTATAAQVTLTREDDGHAFNGDSWEAAPHTFVFSPGDWQIPLALELLDSGTYTLTCDATDAAGHSVSLVGTMLFDADVPLGTIEIVEGEYTDTPLVTLSFSVTGADEYRVKLDDGAFSEWKTMVNSTPFSIGFSDALYQIYVEFRDDVLNLLALSASVTLDTLPPAGTLEIGVGNPGYTASRDVTLISTIDDAARMRFRESGGEFGEFVDFANSADWQLPDVDGTHTVEGEYEDNVQNRAVFSDSIVLDRQLPTCSVTTQGPIQVPAWPEAVTGLASDTGSAVDTVALRIQRESDGMYFQGASWGAITLLTANGTASWSYPLSISNLEENVRYTITCIATDLAGNSSSGDSTFVLDSRAPFCALDVSGPLRSADWPDALTGTAEDEFGDVVIVQVVVKRLDDGRFYSGLNWGSSKVPLEADGTDNWSLFLPLQTLESGKTYEHTVHVTDSAGNQGSCKEIFYLDDTPPTATMLINSGDPEYATTEDVTLLISQFGATTIQIANDSDAYGAPSEIADEVVWQLADVDGLRTVTVKLSDDAGNFVEVSDTITLDRGLPSGTIELIASGNDGFTRERTVTLRIQSDAVEYRARINSEAFSDWLAVPARADISFELLEDDGLQIVTVEFRDEAHNAISVQEQIILDRVAPTGGFSINAGDPIYTNSANVTLVANAVGAFEMRYRTNNETFIPWQDYEENFPWTLEVLDGSVTVFAEFRDEAGNVLAVSDDVLLDRAPPAGVFSIGVGDPAFTTSRLVTLASGISGAVEMRLSTPITEPTGWFQFSPEFFFELENFDGQHTVIAEYRDAAGNMLLLQDDIIVDRVPPTCLFDQSGVFSVTSWPGEISGTLSDDRSGLNNGSIRIRRVADGFYFTGSVWQVGLFTFAFSEGPWQIDLDVNSLSDGATYQVTCDGQDNAGNVSLQQASSFVYDDSPPACSFDQPGILGPLVWPGKLTATLTDATAISGTMFLIRDADGLFYDGVDFQEDELGFDQIGTAWLIAPPAALFENGQSYSVRCLATDEAGNGSDTEGSFVWDESLPTGGFTINEGNPAYSQAYPVELIIAVEGAVELRFRNSNNALFTDWFPLPANGRFLWSLFQSDGLRTVIGEFRDEANNVSIFSDTIILDTVVPTGEFEIGFENPTFTTSFSVTLYNGVVGATQMRFGDSTGTFSEWFDFSSQHPWTLLSEQGIQAVTAEFADNAGNALTLSDTIEVDTIAPFGSFTIGPDNPTYTVTHRTELLLFIEGGDEMRVKTNNTGFTQWAPYVSNLSHRLQQGVNSLQTITVEVRDVAGNVSSFQDTIILDQEFPTCTTSVNALYSPSDWPGVVGGTVTEAVSGLASSELIIFRQSDGLHYDGSSWVASAVRTVTVGDWSVALPLAKLDDGERYFISCEVSDIAGNSSAVETVSFLLDASAPSCIVDQTGVFGPDTWPGKLSGTLTDAGSGTATAKIFMTRTDGSYFSGKSWGPAPFSDNVPTVGDWTWPFDWEGSDPETPNLVDDETYTLTCTTVDGIGNTGTSIYTFTFQTNAPTGSIAIGSGNPVYATTRSVTIHTTVDDAVEMRLRNEGEAFGDWLDFEFSLSWVLNDVDGQQTVDAEFRNAVGNTLIVSDTIFLDRQPPICTIFTSGVFNLERPPGEVAGVVADATSGFAVGTLQIFLENGFYYNGTRFVNGVVTHEITEEDWSLDFHTTEQGQPITISCAATDNAGNTSAPVTSQLIFDTVTPVCEVLTTGTFAPATWPQNVNFNIEDTFSEIVSSVAQIQRQNDNFYFHGTGWAAEEFTFTLPPGPSALPLSSSFLDDDVTYVATCTAEDEAGNVGVGSGVFIYDALPPTGSFSVGIDDPAWIISTTPTLDIQINGAIEMRFATDDNGEFSEWITYASTHVLTISDTAGFRTVFAQFRDEVGNVFSTTDTFTLDVIPPVGTMSINSGNPEYATIRSVTLAMTVTGANLMRFSADGGDFSDWITISATHSLELDDFDGQHVVLGQFTDEAGHILELEDTIILDTAPPVGTFSVGVGNPAGVNESVTVLRMSVGGADEMRFRMSTDPTFTNWRPYDVERDWTLEGVDGEYTVFGQFRDNAGLFIEDNDTVILDRVAPVCVINTSGLYTANTWPEAVTGTTDDDRAGVLNASVSIQRLDTFEYYTGSAWSPQQLSVPLSAQIWSVNLPKTLLTGGVNYRVTCQANDAAGNVASITSQFGYDNEAPICTIAESGEYGPNSWPGTISGTLTDALSGVAGALITVQRLSDGFYYAGGLWAIPRTEFPITQSGSWNLSLPQSQLSDAVSYRIRCVGTDNSGNESDPVSSDIFFDSVAPSGSFSVEAGNPIATNQLNVTLSVGIAGATEMRFANDEDDWSDWIEFAVTEDWTLTDLTGERTVHAEFRDDALNVLALSDEITYDIQPPFGTMTIGFDNLGTRVRDVLIVSNITGATEMRLQNDSDGWSLWVAYEEQYDWLLKDLDGQRLVQVQYRDHAENLFHRQDVILLDSTPPSGSFSIGEGNPGSVDSAVTVLDIDITEASEMRFANAGAEFGAWTLVTSLRNWQLEDADGIHEVLGEFRDTLGNVAALSDTVILDRAGPTCTLDQSGVMRSVDWEGAFSGQTVDATSAVTTTQVSIKRLSDGFHFNGQSWQPSVLFLSPLPADNWSINVSVGLLSEGTYEVSCVGIDEWGNTAVSNSTVKIDDTAPVCNLDQIGTYNASNWAGAVSGTTLDATSEVVSTSILIRRETDNRFFNGTDWGLTPSPIISPDPTSWQLSLPLDLLSGQHDYAVLCTTEDTAGNSSQLIAGVFRVDLIGPQGTMHINVGDPAATKDRNVTVISNVTEAVSVQISTLGSAPVKLDFRTEIPWQLPIFDGLYTITAIYEDIQGNSTTLSDSIAIDSQPPAGSFSIGAGNPDAVSSTDAQAANSVSGASEMRFKVAGSGFGPWLTYASSAALVLPDVQDTITAQAEFRDVAGNVLALSDTVTLDTEAPTGSLVIESGDPEFVNSPEVTVIIDVSGAVEYRLRNDSQDFPEVWTSLPAQNHEAAWTLRDLDGGRVVAAEFRDTAGNVLAVGDLIILDQQAPVCTSSVSGSYHSSQWPGAIEIQVTDGTGEVQGASITLTRQSDGFSFDGLEFVNDLVPLAVPTPALWSIELPAGIMLDSRYVLTCLATDSAGNSGSDESTFTIDSTPPGCVINAPPLAGPASWPNAVEGTATDDFSDVSSVSLSIQRDTDSHYFNGLGWQPAPFFAVASGTDDWSVPLPAAQLTNGAEYSFICRATDQAGNTGEEGPHVLTFDSAVPVGSFAIGVSDPARTNILSASLVLDVSDGHQIRFRNGDAGDFSEWFGIVDPVAWTLADLDGERTVNAELQDEAGNTITLSDTIVLDRAPPAATLAIDGPSQIAVNSRDLDLIVSPDDASDMRIGLDGALPSFGAVGNVFPLQLPDVDGSYTIVGEFRDDVGNVSEQRLTVTLDRVPPVATFAVSIAETTRLRNVTLFSSGTGIEQMRFRTAGEAFGDFIDFSSSFSWTLPDADGSHTVFAQFQDLAGNAVGASDSISLDRAGPVVTFASSGTFGIGTWPGAVSGNATDLSGVSSLNITVFRDSDQRTWNGSLWLSGNASVSASGDPWLVSLPTDQLDSGRYQLVALSQDIVGNTSQPALGAFTIDADLPGCGITLNPSYNTISWPGSISGTSSGGDVAHIGVAIQRQSDGFYFVGNRWQHGRIERTPAGLDTWSVPLPSSFLAHGETYDIEARVTDENGNTSICQDSFNYDTDIPVLTVDPAVVEIALGATVDSFAGVSAQDTVDPSPALAVSPAVDPFVLGDQVVAYTATDAAGNKSVSINRVYRVRQEIAGNVEYLGLQQGDIYVQLQSTAHAVLDTIVLETGEFNFSFLVVAGTYNVIAWLDSTVDAAYNEGEAEDLQSFQNLLVNESIQLTFKLSDWRHEYVLRRDWNPLSAPGPFIESDFRTLFPLHLEPVVTWAPASSEYVTVDSPTARTGMMVMMAVPGTVEVRGIYDGVSEITVQPGWNLVGVNTPIVVPDDEGLVVLWEDSRGRPQSLVPGESMVPFVTYWLGSPAALTLDSE